MPNLKEQIEAYANYLITAGVTAILAVGGTLGVQAFRNWLNPQIPASAITGEMLQATHGANVEELTQRRTQLQEATEDLTQARTAAQAQVAAAQGTFDAAQAAVTAAGEGGATVEQQAALTAAQTALTDAQTAFTNAQAALTANTEAIAGLTAQINNEGAVATLIGNNDQRAILVNRLNQIPVPSAPALAGATN